MPSPLDPYFRARLPTPPPPLPVNWPAQPPLLDPESADAAVRQFSRDLLANVQGNILKFHGRTHGAIVYFRARPGANRPADFWQQIEATVTWAQTQFDQARLNRMTPAEFAALQAQTPGLAGIDPDARHTTVWRGFALTARGLRALDAVDDRARNEPVVFEGNRAGSQPVTLDSFQGGMKGKFDHHIGFEDEIAGWETYFADGVDGLWIVACDDANELAAAVNDVKALCTNLGLDGLLPFPEQPLTTWPERTGQKRFREPFGFVDGISVPAFFQSDFDRNALGGPWSQLPLSGVLISPELSASHAGGSFLVLRKLEQDVLAFRNFEHAHGTDAVECIVGRTRPGFPLVARLPHAAGVDPQNEFDFNGEFDPAAPSACPFHAHIRKVNPRVDSGSTFAVMGKNILESQPVRRGMVFDPAGALVRAEAEADKGNDAAWPDRGVGLIFLAYMADIYLQFEKIYFEWIHGPDFVTAGTGGDALLAPTAPLKFVTSQGGDYFYVPSRPWLLRR